jgi:hypothetical protein
MFTPHPSMTSAEISTRTQKVWDRFYEFKAIWKRSACAPTLRARIGFVLLSKLYRQMYAGTGISTDSARRKKAKGWARWTARQTRKVFTAKPMPQLKYPEWTNRSNAMQARSFSLLQIDENNSRESIAAPSTANAPMGGRSDHGMKAL